MAQLRCTFFYEPDDDLRALGKGELWSFGLSIDEFFARAPQPPGIRADALVDRMPQSLRIEYSDV